MEGLVARMSQSELRGAAFGGLRWVEGALRGKRVFLTGHTGFKGSWLAMWLQRMGAHVTGYALAPSTAPSNYTLSGVERVVEAEFRADIRDTSRLAEALAACIPDVVFHLAAQPLVLEGYRRPVETMDVNVMGTAHLLEAIRTLELRCAVVVVTSDKCYQELDKRRAFVEEDAMGGRDPYSASKGAAELVTACFREAFFPFARFDEHGVQVATARSGNVVGGGDWAANRLIPDCVRALVAGENVILRRPEIIRPWQHVLEPLWGYLLLAAHMLEQPSAKWSQGWNFGPSSAQQATVLELVNRFISVWGSGGWRDCSEEAPVHESPFLGLCSDKAESSLGWRPSWGLETTVQRTARWYRSLESALESAQAACCADIVCFEQALLSQGHGVEQGVGHGQVDDPIVAAQVGGRDVV